MVGILQPNPRGKSGRYSWVAFKEHWKPATSGSKGFGLPGSISDFNSFFLEIDRDLALSGGKLIHWSKHEADILEEHLSSALWKELKPRLFNARLPAKRYARKRRIFEGSGKTIGKSLEEFFEVVAWKQLNLHRKPIVVLNVSGCWSRLTELTNDIVMAGFAHENIADLYSMVETVDDIFRVISEALIPDHRPVVKRL